MADDVKNEDGRGAAAGDPDTGERIKRLAVPPERTRSERISNLSQALKAFLSAAPDVGTVTEVRRAGLALAQGGGT